MREPAATVLAAFCLYGGCQLVWLAEKAAASAMLWPLALVVGHGVADYVLAVVPARISGVIAQDISWKAMLGEDEREATEEEIVALEAEHGPFQSPDTEG